jgi:hypothetical protein
MKFILSQFLVLVVLLLSLSCNTEVTYPDSALGLSLKDFSCTEAWIEVQIGANDKTANIYIKKNDEIIKTIKLGQSDSLFYFDDLQPNTAYRFNAVTYDDGTEIKSNPVSFTTLDTTSHNFTWQTFTFGQHSSSTLYDVAIINKNDIWAVGEIYMNDSLGNPDTKIYNAVRWNGLNWELKRIRILLNGTPFYPVIKSIFAFNENDIWFEAGIHWDGITFKQIPFNIQWNGNVNKLWGSSSNDLYAVGKNGNIAHYNGTIWSNIESGTTSILNDAWGITNEQNKTIVYCAASSFFVPGDKKILKIVDGKVDSVNWGKDVRLYSAWTNNENFLYVCGEGVFVNKFGTWEQITLPPITTNSIRGNDINDVFAVGSLGTIFHFNGISWQVISSYTQKENYRVDFKNNIVAICGYYNGKGFIEIGRRN